MNAPLSLVRFYGNPDYAIDCIETKKLTLPHISKFNDPFDPALDFITEFQGDYDLFLNWVQINKSNSKAKEFKKILTRQVWKKTFNNLKSYAKTTKNSMFAACFCESNINEAHPKDNLYMWGHYANGHRGIAIEFDTKVLISKFGNKCVYKIEYVDELPRITYEEGYKFFMFPDSIELQDLIRQKYDQIIRSKSKKWWKLEKEWRLMWTNDETILSYCKVPVEGLLPDNAILAIYLGCELDPNIIPKITVQAKKNHPNATIYKAEKVANTLALKFIIL